MWISKIVWRKKHFPKKMRIKQRLVTGGFIRSGEEFTGKGFKFWGRNFFRNRARSLTLTIAFVFCGAFALVLPYYFSDEIKYIVFPMKIIPEDFLLKCDKNTDFSSNFVEPRKSPKILPLHRPFLLLFWVYMYHGSIS